MVWFLVPLYFKAQVNPLMSNTCFLPFNFKEKITVAEKRNNYQFRGRTYFSTHSYRHVHYTI